MTNSSEATTVNMAHDPNSTYLGAVGDGDGTLQLTVSQIAPSLVLSLLTPFSSTTMLAFPEFLLG